LLTLIRICQIIVKYQFELLIRVVSMPLWELNLWWF